VLARRFRGREALVTLVELPLVLPPAVAGLGLLAALGSRGLLHTSLPFTQGAVLLAVAFVASPLYVRAGIAAFEGVDANVVAASRTLGAGPVRTFFRVVLPLARDGLAAGAALAFARALGEFGATIMFAGSLRGVTQTLPLAVYSEFAVDFDVALAQSGGDRQPHDRAALPTGVSPAEPLAVDARMACARRGADHAIPPGQRDGEPDRARRAL
jgi:molybdate transport system permease protein